MSVMVPSLCSISTTTAPRAQVKPSAKTARATSSRTRRRRRASTARPRGALASERSRAATTARWVPKDVDAHRVTRSPTKPSPAFRSRAVPPSSSGLQALVLLENVVENMRVVRRRDTVPRTGLSRLHRHAEHAASRGVLALPQRERDDPGVPTARVLPRRPVQRGAPRAILCVLVVRPPPPRQRLPLPLPPHALVSLRRQQQACSATRATSRPSR